MSNRVRNTIWYFTISSTTLFKSPAEYYLCGLHYVCTSDATVVAIALTGLMHPHVRQQKYGGLRKKTEIYIYTRLSSFPHLAVA